MIKPETEMYPYYLDRQKFSPEQSLFIDDNTENIEAACKLGMNGYLFDTYGKSMSVVIQTYNLPA